MLGQIPLDNQLLTRYTEFINFENWGIASCNRIMARKKITRLSGIKERTVYRDAKGHFAKRGKHVAEEIWKFREANVNGKKKIADLKIEYLPYRKGHVEKFGSIDVPQTGARAGKISVVLDKVLGKLGVDRHDTRIDISMTARTKDGEIIRRKVSIWHYNSHKLVAHTKFGILHELFYKHGDRPAYPVKIVKGSWRNRETTKKETMERRQLYDVTFNIKTDVEKTRKQARKKLVVKPMKKKIRWGMDLTGEDE